MADITWSSVSAWEEMGTREVGYTDENGWTAGVTLNCAGSDVIGLIADLVGNRHAFPPMSAFTNPPVAIGASAVPLATQAAVLTGAYVYDYPYAKVKVTYGIDKGSDFITESFEPNVEFNILDYRRFNWTNNNGDALLEAEAPGKQVYGMNLVRTIYKIDSIPSLVIDGVGHVNVAAFTSAILGLTFPIETLLLLPGSATRTIKTTGDYTQNLTMKFAYKKDGWNKYWRSKTSSYESIYEKASGSIYKSYPTIDMSDLLY